jgi:hypothetical protein
MNQEVFIPTQQKFEEIIERKTASVLKSLIPKIIRQANRKEYLTTSEVQELTGMSSRMQKYHRDEGNLPYSQEGRKIIYRTVDVEKFIEKRRIESASS